MTTVEKNHDHFSNNFNLLRLILASLVVFSHAPVLLDGDHRREPLMAIFNTLTLGHIAVDGFFLLSGYLIVKSWLSEPLPIAFLKKRVLRIYPAFVVASVLCALVVGPLGAASVIPYFVDFSATGYLKSLVFLRVPVVPAVFEGTRDPTVNGSMWTIFFEFLCYLTVLVLGVIGAVKNRRIWAGITVVALALFCLQGFGVSIASMNFSHQVFRLVPIFFVGGCFYLYRSEIVFNKPLAVLFAVILVSSMFERKIAELAVITSGAYLLFFFATARIPMLAAVNRLPDISYGIYLYAWPVKKLILWYFPSISLAALISVSFFASVVLGFASWKLVEAPFLKLKSKRMKSPLSPVATST